MKCQYISAVDKVIFVDDYAVGCRKDLNGILLLDTALQTPVSKQDDVVQLELPVTEVRCGGNERRYVNNSVRNTETRHLTLSFSGDIYTM